MFGILFWIFVFIIFYTYVGYPLLLRVFPGVKICELKGTEQSPSITLLIAAYNEQQVIEKKIQNSLKLAYPHEKLQILIAADGSSDRTVEIINQYNQQGVELSYYPERQGKMAAINHAMQSARNQIVIFSDANNMYRSDTLQELVVPFVDPKVGAVVGAKKVLDHDGNVSNSEGLYWKYEDFIRKQQSRLGCCTAASGEVLAIRRELFDPLSQDIINDDFFIIMTVIRKGYACIYRNQACSYESVSRTSRDEEIRRTRMSAGHFQAMARARSALPMNRPGLVWQVVSHKFMRPLVPFWMIGAFLVSLGAVIFPAAAGRADLLTLAQPYNWLFFVLQCLVYLLAWVGNAWENKSIAGFLYLPTFLVNSNIAALKGFWRYISRQQTNRWQRVERRVVES